MRSNRSRIHRVRIAVLLAVSCAIAAVYGPWSNREDRFQEREETFPLADAETVQAWNTEWRRRAGPHEGIPDPPGAGPVQRERYWISRPAYVMEIRRRGPRITLGIGGVDPQFMGGGWTAFGEGWVEGVGSPSRPFAGTVARISWACLGIRFRHASDGMGKLHFSADGESLEAIYVAHEAPDLWAKSYGTRVVGERPGYGGLRGQIPIAPALARLQAQALYRLKVRVTDTHGVAQGGALVQIKARTHTQALTDEEGRVELCFRGSDAPIGVPVCAGALGCRNGERVVFADDAFPGLVAGGTSQHELALVLEPLDLVDHAGYEWVASEPDVSPDNVMACGTCHQWHYEEWSRSRHATMASNGLVPYERQRMLRAQPNAPDDCRGCHQPGEAATEPGPGWRARGAMAGNHCDLCHKIHHVDDVRESGVLGAISFLRPDLALQRRPGAIHQVFGPLADVTYAYMGAAWNPLFQSSHLCAGCHQGGGRWREGRSAKVNTFQEWVSWAAGAGATAARSCQDCHMPAGQTQTEDGVVLEQIAWDAAHRSPRDVHAHRFQGAEPALAATALRLLVEKEHIADSGQLSVRVALTNAGAGHRVPTGTWSKHVIVGVWAHQGGKPLALREGERAHLVPAEQSAPAAAVGDWRNPAGWVLGVFAADDPQGRRGLLNWWDDVTPAQVADRRLQPGETREGTFLFELQGDGPAEVEVWVVHRRAPLGVGLETLPWSPGPYEGAPEVLWMRVRK